MAIRMRRGVFDNFDPTRMLPGEWAVVLSGDPDAADGYAVYMCFAPGSVKRMATYEDMVENVDEATADIIQAALDGLAEEIAHINAEALPDMSAGQRGIAKLGSGLAMANSALSVDPITSAQIDSVAADASMAGSQSLSLTGLTRIWAKIKAAFAAIAHSHAAADITSGTLAVARGGTGASSTAAARTSLDAAQSEGAAGSLYDAEQAIADLAAATGNVSVATDGSLQSQVNTLRESVSKVERVSKSGDDYLNVYFDNGHIIQLFFTSDRRLHSAHYNGSNWHQIDL